MFVFVDNMPIRQQCLSITPFQWSYIEENLHILCQLWQNRFKVNRKALERIKNNRANFVQFDIPPILFGQFPWFVAMNKYVHKICQKHNFSQSCAIIALFIEISNIFGTG